MKYDKALRMRIIALHKLQGNCIYCLLFSNTLVRWDLKLILSCIYTSCFMFNILCVSLESFCRPASCLCAWFSVPNQEITCISGTNVSVMTYFIELERHSINPRLLTYCWAMRWRREFHWTRRQVASAVWERRWIFRERVDWSIARNVSETHASPTQTESAVKWSKI